MPNNTYKGIIFVLMALIWQWNICIASSQTTSSQKVTEALQAPSDSIMQMIHPGVITSVTISRDSRWILTGCTDKTARLWELVTGKEVRRFDGHRVAIMSAVISGDGHWILTGSADRTARLWEAATGKQVKHFEGHSNMISSVAISENGMWALTGSEDNTARLWQAIKSK